MDHWPALICPADGQTLEAKPDALVCTNGHSYSVANGIPRFVGGRTYADHFGAQWNLYREMQLDSCTGKPIERQQYEWALLDTHDTLTDWYKHRRTRRQIQRALARLGLEDVWCEYGGNGVEARGRRAGAEKTRPALAA